MKKYAGVSRRKRYKISHNVLHKLFNQNPSVDECLLLSSSSHSILLIPLLVDFVLLPFLLSFRNNKTTSKPLMKKNVSTEYVALPTI
jgi:hypothetical protein